MADGNYSDVNAIKAEFSFGLHVLPVSLLVSPEEKYRARAAKQENVDGAVHRLLQFGNVNEHVRSVRRCEHAFAREVWVQAACERR